MLDQQHLQLVEGELINKMGKNQPRVISLALQQYWLVHVFGERQVNSGAPIDVAPQDNPTNEPEPDIIVLNRDLTAFPSANPTPGGWAMREYAARRGWPIPLLRPGRVSRARYTSPMPPAPSGSWISYGPGRVPAESCID